MPSDTSIQIGLISQPAIGNKLDSIDNEKQINLNYTNKVQRLSLLHVQQSTRPTKKGRKLPILVHDSKEEGQSFLRGGLHLTRQPMSIGEPDLLGSTQYQQEIFAEIGAGYYKELGN
jgi:hypothetical protein